MKLFTETRHPKSINSEIIYKGTTTARGFLQRNKYTFKFLSVIGFSDQPSVVCKYILEITDIIPELHTAKRSYNLKRPLNRYSSMITTTTASNTKLSFAYLKNAKRAHEVLGDYHDCCCVVKLPTVVWSTEQCDQLKHKRGM